MATRELYMMKLKSKLDEWDAELDRLQAQAEEEPGERRKEYEDQVATLRAERDKMAERKTNLENCGDSAFDEFRTAFDKAWRELDEGLRRAAERFRAKT